MSRKKKHEDNDENMKIYPDVLPGAPRGLPDQQIVPGPKRGGVKANSVRMGNDTVKNNQGWSK